MMAENESLKKMIYEKSEQLKIANDRVCQLQESNTYRREITRLEGIVDVYDSDVKAKEESDVKKRKIEDLEESLTFFMDDKIR